MGIATLSLAAIAVNDRTAVDALFDRVIATLRAEGFCIAGYVQRETPDARECCPETLVEDVETGALVRISQALGAGSKGCRLDPQALAGVAGAALARLDTPPDLMVLNRFGKGESEGRGLRVVFEKALELEIPVLTCVKENYRPAWVDYAGELAGTLPADEDAVLAWCRAALGNQRN